ncbi:MAG: endonuclease/exonuclease/phosphatase family protein [Sphingomonas sp.]
MVTALRRLAALSLALVFTAPAVAASPPAPLRVMSFNVRTTINVDDGREAWPKRRELFIATIRAAHPDVMGTQELSQMQGDYIVRRLPGYAWFGIDRQGGHADEHMGVFYRRDRLKLVDMGNFWLSETPDVAGSNSWGTPFPRMSTWGLFEDKASGRRFYLFDTHFPYRDQDEPARTKSAKVLIDQIARIDAQGLPVVLTGDFNTTPDSESYALVSQAMTDVRKAVSNPGGPDATFQGYSGKATNRIDWIFERGFTPLTDVTSTTHRGTLYPSDHFPVLATLGWGGRAGS